MERLLRMCKNETDLGSYFKGDVFTWTTEHSYSTSNHNIQYQICLWGL